MEEKTITLTEEQFNKVVKDKIATEMDRLSKRSKENKETAGSDSTLILLLFLIMTSIVAEIEKELFHKEEK